MASAHDRDLARTAGVAAVVAVAAVAMQLAGAWSAFDDALFDTFTVGSAPRPATASPVVVVGIDEPSFSELRMRWPWPRSVHARLVDELTQAGASVVAFDVLFSEPSDPAHDALLARAIAASKRVVLAAEMSLQDTAHFRGMQRVEPLADPRGLRFPGSPPFDRRRMWYGVSADPARSSRVPPADAFSEARPAVARAGRDVRYSDGSDSATSRPTRPRGRPVLPPGRARQDCLVGLP